MLRYYLIGMFFNLFAPGTVGGDVSRVYYLVKDENARAKGHAVTTVHAAMSVLMDRAIGMIVLVWLGAVGLVALSLLRGSACGAGRDFPARPGICLPAAYCCLCCDACCPQDGHQLVVKLRLAFRSYRTHWRALIDSDRYCRL